MGKHRNERFVCVMVANLLGADSWPEPTPAHPKCARKSAVWEPMEDVKRFVVGGYHKGRWVTELPEGTPCHICGKEIEHLYQDVWHEEYSYTTKSGKVVTVKGHYERVKLE